MVVSTCFLSLAIVYYFVFWFALVPWLLLHFLSPPPLPCFCCSMVFFFKKTHTDCQFVWFFFKKNQFFSLWKTHTDCQSVWIFFRKLIFQSVKNIYMLIIFKKWFLLEKEIGKILNEKYLYVNYFINCLVLILLVCDQFVDYWFMYH